MFPNLRKSFRSDKQKSRSNMRSPYQLSQPSLFKKKKRKKKKKNNKTLGKKLKTAQMGLRKTFKNSPKKLNNKYNRLSHTEKVFPSLNSVKNIKNQKRFSGSSAKKRRFLSVKPGTYQVGSTGREKVIKKSLIPNASKDYRKTKSGDNTKRIFGQLKPKMGFLSITKKKKVKERQTKLQKVKIPKQIVSDEVFNSLGNRSIPGMTQGMTKLNQDCIFINTVVKNNPKIALVGVFDGHGMEGHRVSNFIRITFQRIFDINYQYLIQKRSKSAKPQQQPKPELKVTKQASGTGVGNSPPNLQNESLALNQDISLQPNNNNEKEKNNDDEIPEENFRILMKKLCLGIQKLILDNDRINSSQSGSTGVIVLFHYNKIIVANVGDSRAILLVKDKNKTLKALPLTTDHTPLVEAEKRRIMKSGGVVRPHKMPSGKFVGPMRVWKKGKNGPGLMMSRSFGDKEGHDCGMISSPEVTICDWTPEIAGIVIATDGIWEKIPNKIAAKIVEKHYFETKSAVKATNELVNRAIINWKKNSTYMDDISAFVGFFNQEKLSMKIQ